MTDYPPAVPKPCKSCPWRRDAQSGHIGPYSPRDWIKMAHADTAIACHETIVIEADNDTNIGNWGHPKIRQCRGMAVFRENVGKHPRDESVATGPRDEETCFAKNDEFLEHHGDDRPFGPYELYEDMDGPF